MKVSTAVAVVLMTASLFQGTALGAECDSHAKSVSHWDNMTYDDPLVLKYLGKDDQKSTQGTSEPRAKPARICWQLAAQLKLLYETDGGALQPFTPEGNPWYHTTPQLITSLGAIPWCNKKRDAVQIATHTNKPVLLLSTETPGCGACVGHGQNQLSHPFVVDAALEFVPLVVSGGWPMLTVMTSKCTAGLQPGATHQTSVADTLGMMKRGLERATRDVPEWLELVVFESATTNRQTATFGMGCFWEGEHAFGKIDGVLSTRCGELRGEVVELVFDPSVVPYSSLLEQALKCECAGKVIARTDQQAAEARALLPENRVFRMDTAVRPLDNDTKYNLKQNRVYAALPLTELQATKLNSLGKRGESCLSPSQRILKTKLVEFFNSGKTLGEMPHADRSLGGVRKRAEWLRKKLLEGAERGRCEQCLN